MKNFLWGVVIVLSVVVIPVHAEAFTLEEGWNLVSFDILNSLGDRNLSDEVLSGGAIFGLNPKDKKYYGGEGSMPEVEKGLSQIVPALPYGDESIISQGFWLYTQKVYNLDINFDTVVQVEEKFDTTSYHLIKGWNLVGVTKLMTNRSLDDIKGSCGIQSWYGFENAEGGWLKGSENDMKQKLTTSLGRAYAIKVENDCAFNFKGASAQPNIPALPN